MSGHDDVISSVVVAIIVLIVLAWSWSLVRRRHDLGIVWALGVVAVAWMAWWVGDGDRGRRDLLTAMVTLWGLRRTVHLWRWTRLDGSPPGDEPTARSLLTRFAPLGLFMFIVTLPVQVAATPRTPMIGWPAVAGAALWGIGFFLETVGDAEPDRGLWRLVPHPPRIGEICVWWGMFVVAAETADARGTVVAPILMTIVLTRHQSFFARRPLP